MSMRNIKNYVTSLTAEGYEEDEVKIRRKPENFLGDRKITCTVVGVSFEGRDKTIKTLCQDDKILIERDPANKYDSNCISVSVVREGKKESIGFVPKEMAANLAPVMDFGFCLEASIKTLKKFPVDGVDEICGVDITILKGV